VLIAHAPALRIDVVLADTAAVGDVEKLRDTVTVLGAELVVAPVGAEGPAPVHHPQRLATAFTRIMCPDSPVPGSE
jgi:hypothetical protein